MNRVAIVFLFLATASFSHAQIITQGLVAYYPLDGNAADGSGNGYHGTPYGAVPVAGRDGTPNGAYFFDGADDWIDMGDTRMCASAPGATIACWVKSPGLTGIGCALFQHGDDQYPGASGIATRVMRLDIAPDGSVGLHVNNVPPSPGIGIRSATGAFAFNDTWHHLAATYDQSNGMDVYVDGVHASHENHTLGPIADLLIRSSLGQKYHAVPGQWFRGSIDDMYVFNRALSATEIQVLAGAASANANVLSLDGVSDHVLLNTGPVLSTLPQHTIELWFKWEGIKNPQFPVQGRDMGQAIYTENRDGGATYRIVINGDSTVEFLFDHAYAGYTAVTSTTKIVMDRWYHVAGTFDNISGKKIYINGILEDSDPDTRLPSDGSGLPSNEVFLGKDNLGGGNLADFCGKIDEVRAWRVVRSAGDIAANMCSPVPSWERPYLAGYWRMEGNYADSSASALHGLPRHDARLVEDAVCEELFVLAPNGGESFQIGQLTPISWDAPTVSHVDLFLSTNGGVNWDPIATAVPAGTGSYPWTVPATPSTQCLVKVSSSSNPAMQDVSDALFTIRGPAATVQVVRPNGGEIFTVADVEQIQWTGTVSGNVDLYFSTDNGTSWNQIATGVAASAGSYLWTVPNAPSTTCLVRVRSTDDPAVLDVSDVPFTIQAPAPELTVVRPNGGEQLNAGTIFTVQWHAPSSTTVRLEYSTDAGNSWLPVAAGVTAASGSYAWNVPNTPSQQCLMRITDDSDPQVTDQSDGYFEIRMQRELRLIRPNGGEVWYVGDTNRISWSSSGIARVNIECSTDDGASWSVVLLDAEASATRHDWRVPDTPSKRCRVRLTATDNAALQDGSNAAFEIARRPQLALLTPDGGERWMVGSVENIRWTASSVEYINLDFSSDNGQTWTRILERYAAFRQSWTWKIPSAISPVCLVRISDVDGRVADESRSVFEIFDAPLRVVTPNGGEVWDIGLSRYVTWTSRGVQRVRIDYSHDRGQTWINVARSVPAADAKYAWTVPDTPSDTCYILLRDEDNASISDLSDAVFEIRQPPAVEVLTPNGEEVWRTGTTHLITWNSFNVADVRIEYSYDDGANWAEIAGPVPAGKRSHDWRIPDHHSAFCLVRVSDYADAAVFDVSDAHFDIVPNKSVTLSAPVGGEQLITGSTFSITWSSINVASVRLEFSSDNGSTWTEIAARIASTGIFAWTVPQTLTMQGRIRITDVDDALVFDTSPGNFQIQSATGIASASAPGSVVLHQNYPNPFNPSTTIPFSVHHAGPVTIRVHDLYGREVAVLVDDWRDAGEHRVVLQAEHLPAGVYICRLSSGRTVVTRTMTLLK